MFGYVTPDLNRLPKEVREEYRAYYCGVCNALRNRYGARARFILNYDTTCLYLFLDGLQKCDKHTSARCPYHLGRKCHCTKGALADYAADVTVILSYLNFADDVTDDGSLKAKIMMKLFKKQYERAKEYRPELCGKIEEGLRALHTAEAQNETNADIPSGIFGGILGEAFAFDERARKFGEYLGKFIYLCDAACDFKSDLKHGHYNPFVTYRTADFYPILTGIMADCVNEYNTLDIKVHDDIITNVLYHGIWIKYYLKYKGKINNGPL